MNVNWNVTQLEARGTIVSLFPVAMKDEYKPDLVPSHFVINAGDPKLMKLGLTHVDSVRRRVFLGWDRGGYTFVLTPASELCDSLINDFLNSTIEVTPDAKPALMWVPGILDEETIKSKYKDEIKEIYDNQVRWFTRLVEVADDMWEKSRTHRSITDIQKYAAQFLNQDREWLLARRVQEAQTLATCPVCTAKISPSAMVCFNCKEVVKPAEYAAYKAKTVAPVGATK